MQTFHDYDPEHPFDVSGEKHTISGGLVRLENVPLKGSVRIPGFTERTDDYPRVGEFYIDYQEENKYKTATQKVVFNAADNGKNIEVTYKGVSTIVFAKHFNEIGEFMRNFSEKAYTKDNLTNATQTVHGLMSADDKKKLDEVKSGATAVSFTQILSKGVKIGTITIDGQPTDIYCENGGSGVSFTKTQTSGTKIGSITIDGTSTDIYAPSVSFSRSLTSGTKIGSITINGTSTDIYCSNSGNTVSFSRSLVSGTKIGSITINGTATDIYAPTPATAAATQSANGLMSADDKKKLDGIQSGATVVSFSRSLTSGTKIGSITINGETTDLYCQAQSGGNADTATKLKSAVTLTIKDATNSHSGTGASFDGSKDLTINLPATITATLIGNASTATTATTATTAKNIPTSSGQGNIWIA